MTEPAPTPPAVPQTRSELWAQTLFVHAVMLATATGILWWNSVAPLDLFAGARPLAIQAGIGAGLALVLLLAFAGGEWLIFRRSPSTDHLLDVPAVRQLTLLDCLLIGLLTGFVTEFLWRGAVQSWVGVVGATLVHGALYVLFAPTATGRVIMVVCGLALAAVCGLLTIHVGLVSAIVLRTVYELCGTAIVRQRAVWAAVAPPPAVPPA